MDFFNEFKVKIKPEGKSYTNKLGFINIMKPNGEWKFTDASYGKWRTNVVEFTEEFHDNKPTSGFIVNQTIQRFGQYSTTIPKVRILDPRGFEVEITLENFFNILSYGISSGGVIETELVYVYKGNSLNLIPANSPLLKSVSLESESDFTKDLISKGFNFFKNNQTNRKTCYLGRHYKMPNEIIRLYNEVKVINDNAPFLTHNAIKESIGTSANVSLTKVLVTDEDHETMKRKAISELSNSIVRVSNIMGVTKRAVVDLTASKIESILSEYSHIKYVSKQGISFLLAFDRRYLSTGLSELSSFIGFISKVDFVTDEVYIHNEGYSRHSGKASELIGRLYETMDNVEVLKIETIPLTTKDQVKIIDFVERNYYS